MREKKILSKLRPQPDAFRSRSDIYSKLQNKMKHCLRNSFLKKQNVSPVSGKKVFLILPLKTWYEIEYIVTET